MTTSQIQVAVNAGPTSFPGTVHQLTTGGVVAMFQAETCPTLHQGRVMQLVLSSTLNGAVIPVEAKLTGSREMPPIRCYSFAFRQPIEDLQPLLGQATQENRRRSTRLALNPGEEELAMVVPADVVPLLPEVPGVAVMKNDAVSVSAEARNLSHGGVCACVTRQAELAFVASDRIHVELGLVPDQPPRIVHGHIRHRQEVGDMLHFGIEFDWDHTPQARDIQRELTVKLVKLKKR